MEKLLNDYKISFTKGDTYALAVKFKNITSDLGSAYFTVKENADDEPLIQKSLGAGVSKIDDRSYKQEKTYKIQLQSEDTANLEPLVQYLYDFRVAFGNVVQTILSGVFVVKHSISDVSTTSTTTLDVTLSDVLESDVSTTPATQGIEYEQDPVACAKIGDLTGLSTTDKETIVKAINEVNTKLANEAQTITTKISEESTARAAEDEKLKKRLSDVEDCLSDIDDGTKIVPNATNATNAKNAINLKLDYKQISLLPNDGSFFKVDYEIVPKGLYLVGYDDSNGADALPPAFFLSPLYLDGDEGGIASAYIQRTGEETPVFYELNIYCNEGANGFTGDFCKTVDGTKSTIKEGILYFVRIGGLLGDD